MWEINLGLFNTDTATMYSICAAIKSKTRPMMTILSVPGQRSSVRRPVFRRHSIVEMFARANPCMMQELMLC